MYCYRVIACRELRPGGCSDVPDTICFPELCVDPRVVRVLVHMRGGEKVAVVRVELL